MTLKKIRSLVARTLGRRGEAERAEPSPSARRVDVGRILSLRAYVERTLAARRKKRPEEIAASHLDHLARKFLPELDERYGKARTTRLWSAGCSGEHAYALAMICCDHHRRNRVSDFHILATGLDPSAVAREKLGLYEPGCLGTIPDHLVRRYTNVRLEGDRKKLHVMAELRRRVDFRCLDLATEDYDGSGHFDAIFFGVNPSLEPHLRSNVAQKLCNHLHEGGLFFVQQSEGLPNGADLPLRRRAESIYERV